MKGWKKDVTFPLYIMSSRDINNKRKLGYIYFNKDKVVKYNMSESLMRHSLLSCNLLEDGGIFIKQEKVNEYKLLLKTSSENIENIIKGNYNGIEYNWYSKYGTTIHTEEDLIRYLESSSFTHHLVITSGISSISVSHKQQDFVVVDFILDENYEAIGVKVEREDEVYDVNIKDVPLNIIGKTIVCISKMYKGNIIGKLRYVKVKGK
jgi:hypothetical protein